MTHRHFELVQIRGQSNGQFQSRCLETNGKSESMVTSSLEDAFECIIPTIAEAEIRLLTLQNFEFTPSVAFIAMTLKPKQIDRLSMVSVCLDQLDATLFQRLLSQQLRATDFSFSALRNVHSAHFNDQLLSTTAFLAAKSIEIDVYDFKAFSLPCLSIFDRDLLNWFFGGEANGQRIFIANRMKLSPHFVEELINRFLCETTANCCSLILCGRLLQCKQNFHVSHFNGLESLQVENEGTDEVLRVQILLSEKLEISLFAMTTTDAEPIEEAMTLIDNQPIGYQRYGQGPENFLFICGGVGNYKKDFPEHVLRAFDPNLFTIVCIDPPGYGKSRPPERQQERDRCKKDAKFCLELMKTLNLTPFSVLGWSEGGRTSVHVANQGKSLVKRAVLIALTTRIEERIDQAFLNVRNTDGWVAEMKESFLAHMDEETLRTQWAAICDTVHNVFLNWNGRFPSDALLGQLKLPCLVISGAKDRFIMDQKQLVRMLPNAREEVHSQGGHDFYIKVPRWLALKVTTFVQETAAKI
ncbi:putative alpha/beta hydrolase [Aphelenchoides besseyi]|nr:putative alpha/beta hydrolase [Aphelenchoides besseyi]